MHVIVLLLTLACSMSGSAEEECGCVVYQYTNYAECSDVQKTEIPTCVPDDIIRLHLLFNREFLFQGNLTRFRKLEVLHIFGMPALNLTLDLLRGLESLTSLYIRYSNVSQIPAGFFYHTPNLSLLDLSSNGLRYIPPGLFANVLKVKYISLANNSLQTLPPETFSSSHQLLWLNLDDNPWNCDCGLREQIRWLRISQVVMGDARCIRPFNLKGITLVKLSYKVHCMDKLLYEMGIYIRDTIYTT